ncbi:MAG: gliding motility protein GldN, partial [Phaeodactylibacter sp.]|nr:gliding motility protein GldN [Phaeodactylibacter sp.]
SWGETTQIISEELGYQDIKRFRLKEVWYVDSRTGEMNVRILGIAPLKEQYDNDGNFKYEYPIFWVYYPNFRQLLSRESVFMPGNDAAAFSWEDLFETRKFSSTLYKTSNISDLRLKDMYSGVDRLLEADRINSALFNIEDGLWSH